MNALCGVPEWHRGRSLQQQIAWQATWSRTGKSNMYSQIPTETVTSAFQLVSYVFTAIAALASMVLLRR
jgi:hypothetical protein